LACSLSFPADIDFAPRRVSCSDHATGVALVECRNVGQCLILQGEQVSQEWRGISPIE
jgi:hypothetical protein